MLAKQLLKEINLACMFGYAVNKEGKVQIANRIFETRLYNYFLSEEELSNAIGKMAQRDKGYMLSFNFNKKKHTGVRTITLGNKAIVEAVV